MGMGYNATQLLFTANEPIIRDVAPGLYAAQAAARREMQAPIVMPRRGVNRAMGFTRAAQSDRANLRTGFTRSSRGVMPMRNIRPMTILSAADMHRNVRHTPRVSFISSIGRHAAGLSHASRKEMLKRTANLHHINSAVAAFEARVRLHNADIAADGKPDTPVLKRAQALGLNFHNR